MVNAQNWLDTQYATKNDTEIILHDERTGLSTSDSDRELEGELVVEDFPNLTKLNLERKDNAAGTNKMRGKISKVTIRNCPNLERVDLDENEITELILGNGVGKLNYLDLIDNKLTKIDVGNVPKLNDLIVSGNTNLEKIQGMENLDGIPQIAKSGVTGAKAVSLQLHKEWKEAIINLLGITGNSLPDTWQADLAGKLGGKNLTNIPSGKTLKDLIDNFSSDKDSLQKQLDQAKAELDGKKDYDTLKAERDNLKQQLEAVKNELGVGSNATQQKTIDKIKELKGRPTTACTHTDYDTIKGERDSLRTEVEAKKQRISELESKNKGNNYVEVLVEKDKENFRKWNIKTPESYQQKLQTASVPNEVEEIRGKIIGDKINELEQSKKNGVYLNIGLGVLAAGSLLAIVWLVTRDKSAPTGEAEQENKEK